MRAPSITASAIPEYVLSVEYEISGYGLDVSTKIDVTEANARLIAAAPDLADALANLAGLYDTPVERRRRSSDAFYTEAIQAARAALAKAHGK